MPEQSREQPIREKRSGEKRPHVFTLPERLGYTALATLLAAGGWMLGTYYLGQDSETGSTCSSIVARSALPALFIVSAIPVNLAKKPREHIDTTG